MKQSTVDFRAFRIQQQSAMAAVPQENPDTQAIMTNPNEPLLELPQFAEATGSGSEHDPASHDQSCQDLALSLYSLPAAINRSASSDAGPTDLAAASVVEISAAGRSDITVARPHSATGSASSRPGKAKVVYSRLYEDALASQRLRADFAKAVVAAERDALAAEAPRASPVSPAASLRRPASPGGSSRPC